ncbi:hypothetical protein [Sphingomonas sp. LaA6.9]|uniref:hypothetical protein n=1 Tax=Sphingomonas sp. LaA6.9 TaxID=2919914 RepID=UPI001F4FE8F2|nr:hypothetical protein [Sphingomonas sp. LaA6.9]MCJ8157663.1 hypothetical protein [Sphingomonas sp. LaA6.9]
MRVADRTISISDFRRLGALEIYEPAALAAFAVSKEPKKGERKEVISDDLSFRIEDLFASRTKFLRLLWLARRPGVLPMALMHRFGLAIAQRTVGKLLEEGALNDIRVTAALAAQAAFLDGQQHAASVHALRAAVHQAIQDHSLYGSNRAADGCAIVHAALDPDGHEAGAEAAYFYLQLFPKDENWLRAELLALVRNC